MQAQMRSNGGWPARRAAVSASRVLTQLAKRAPMPRAVTARSNSDERLTPRHGTIDAGTTEVVVDGLENWSAGQDEDENWVIVLSAPL